MRWNYVLLFPLFGFFLLSACWDEGGMDGDTPPYDITAVAIDPVNPDVVYLGTGSLASSDVAAGGDGVYKSIDGGGTWRRIEAGLLDQRIGALAVDLFDPNTVYAGTEGGVYEGIDADSVEPGVESWLRLVDSGTGIVDIVIDRFSCNTKGLSCSTIYAASENDGVRKSTNGGRDWSLMNEGLTETAVKSLTISPPLYLPGTFPDECPDSPETCDDIRDVFPFFETISTLYVGTEEGHVFRFDNEQQIWVEDSPSLSDITNREVLSLAVDPTVIPTIVYAGLRIEGGGIFNLYRRIGQTWFVVNVPGTIRDSVRVIDFALAPDENNVKLPTIYVGISGLSKSSEEGVWVPINKGLDLINLSILSLAIDPQDPNTMYAGSFNSRLFKTEDGGQSWIRIPIAIR